MSSSDSSSDSCFFSSCFSSLLSLASPAATGAAAPAAGALPTLQMRSPMFLPSNAFAKSPGQNGSTDTLAVFIILDILSA